MSDGTPGGGEHPARRADAEYAVRTHVCEAIAAGRAGGLSDHEIAALLNAYERHLTGVAFTTTKGKPRQPDPDSAQVR
jgi:hypothetical protein